jgi:hypothetical protein
VGEVDQLDDPVDERVAERYQRPDRTVREPILEIAGEPREVVLVGPVEIYEEELVRVREVTDRADDRQYEEDDDQSVFPEPGARALDRPALDRGARDGGGSGLYVCPLSLESEMRAGPEELLPGPLLTVG